MELNGRWEGAGALQVMVYEYKQCPRLNPLPPISQDFQRLKEFKSRIASRFINVAEQGPLEFEQQDRKELDNIVLESIGFVEKEEREKALNEIIRAWGLNPEEILTREALTKPHATVISREQIEESQLHQLSIALKQQLLKEM